jgi:hypothetical protein
MTPAKVNLAMAAMSNKETVVNATLPRAGNHAPNALSVRESIRKIAGQRKETAESRQPASKTPLNSTSEIC